MLFQGLLFGMCSAVLAIEMPSYITPCAYDDPDLNGCGLREARKGIKTVINGDPKYRIPKLEPLIIQELKVDQDPDPKGVGFSFVANNGTLIGLSNVKIQDIRMDLKRMHVEYDLEFPRLEMNTVYKADGKVLRLPIKGTGFANVTIIDAKATYRYNYTLEKRDDGDYAIITDNKLEAAVDGRVYVHLDKINGEKILADYVSDVLNDNWQDLVRDVAPTIADAFAQVIKMVLGGMFDNVSMQNAFPGHPSS